MYTNAIAAAESCFSVANARRVVAQLGAKYLVCSRSKARRLGAKIITKNY